MSIPDVIISWDEPKFKIDEKKGTIKCNVSGTLKLFDSTKEFYGTGVSNRMEGNVFSSSFGKSFSYTRALQDVARKMELYHAKYSCEHLLEDIEELEKYDFSKFLRSII